MNILVFSDSHRSRGEMYDAIEAHKPQQIIHLGDLVEDAEDVSYAFPQLPFCMVPGNCDGWSPMPAVRNIVLGGKRVLLSHGHLWRVKGGYDTAIAEGEKAGADLLLFGHTHTAVCQQTESGMWVLNPGSARSTYGLVTIEGDHMECKILKMP